MTKHYVATFEVEYAVDFEAEDDSAAQIIAESCDPVREGDIVLGPEIIDVTVREADAP